MWTRTFAASAFVAALFLACGGRTDGVGPSGSSSGASSGSSSGSSSGGSSGSSSGGSSGSSSGGTTKCVYVDLNTYDRSCNTASDCVYISGGDVCDGSCADCGSDLINVDGLSRYQSAIAPIQLGQCYCGAPSPPECIDHQCTTGVDVVDAGPPDSGVCVNVDLSTYDLSCKSDSDCIEITSGEICSGSCACGGSTINADGQARYDQQLSQVDLAPCGCPAFGVARCITGTCTLCPFGPNGTPSCADGG
jgi:hypothetical protein